MLLARNPDADKAPKDSPAKKPFRRSANKRRGHLPLARPKLYSRTPRHPSPAPKTSPGTNQVPAKKTALFLKPARPTRRQNPFGTFLLLGIRNPQPAIRNSVKGPIIEQQQNKRQRHDHRLRQKAPKQNNDSDRAQYQVLNFAPLTLISGISEHREQPEKSAQHVLALGHPRHRFHMHRMPREKGRDKRASPHRTRHHLQHIKKQQRICGVEQKTGQMMPSRV